MPLADCCNLLKWVKCSQYCSGCCCPDKEWHLHSNFAVSSNVAEGIETMTTLPLCWVQAAAFPHTRRDFWYCCCVPIRATTSRNIRQVSPAAEHMSHIQDICSRCLALTGWSSQDKHKRFEGSLYRLHKKARFGSSSQTAALSDICVQQARKLTVPAFFAAVRAWSNAAGSMQPVSSHSTFMRLSVPTPAVINHRGSAKHATDHPPPLCRRNELLCRPQTGSGLCNELQQGFVRVPLIALCVHKCLACSGAILHTPQMYADLMQHHQTVPSQCRMCCHATSRN